MRLRIAVTFAAASASAGLAAQQTTFKSAVDLVRLDVSVLRGGQPVRGLTGRDFSITDNGVPQRVNSVALLDAMPVSVVITLDTSGSMTGDRLPYLIEAGKGLLAALRPDDRAALITFSQDVRVRVPLTADKAAIQASLSDLAAEGPTSIRDAVWAALQVRPDDDSRPLVLVFTDGADTSSWLSSSDIVTAASRSGVVIHAVELSAPARVSTARGTVRTALPSRFLSTLTEAAGGRQWSATSSRDLRELFTRAIDEMRARYVVTFYPEGGTREGWHALKVSVSNARGNVTTRPGYFVPPRN